MGITGYVKRMGRGQAPAGFGSGNMRERDYLENLRVDGKITLKRIFKKRDEVVEWLDLAQYRDRWRALINTVMNLRFA
jgi:hypothetical protein